MYNKKKQVEIQSLQILRAIASTSVVYFHIKTFPVFGSFGVDIFFIISGFVMAMIIAGGQSSKLFAISRIARIIPLYWIVTTGMLVLSAIRPDLLNSTTANFEFYIKSLLFVPYFKENSELMPMYAGGWTLNYEMFFYFCVWFAIVLSRSIYMYITICIIIMSFFILGGSDKNSVVSTFFGYSIIYEFILGMLVYEIYKQNVLKYIPIFIWVTIILSSYVLMALMQTHEISINRLLLFGIPSFFLVLGMVCIEGSIAQFNKLIVNFISSIGDASYATYLTHYFVIEGLRKVIYPKIGILNMHEFPGIIFAIILSLLVGHFVYMHIDSPLSRHFKIWMLSKAKSM